MKKFFFTIVLLGANLALFAQWNNAGNNYTTGRLGIGFSTTPSFALDIATSTPLQGMQLWESNGKFVRIYSPGMTATAFNGVTAAGDAGIIFGTFSGIDTNDFGFVIAPHRANSSGIRISPLGDVGIGVTDTKGYKLAVRGKAIAEEIVVKLQTNWPDYVFEENYNLLSLSEIEKFIIKNKHLPEIPSAEEIKEKGFGVGEMNTLLVKKVEELTLHLIELNNRNKELEKRLLQLEKVQDK